MQCAYRPTACYPKLVGKRVPHTASSHVDQTATPSFQELAAQQGVVPIDNFDALLGKPAPEDETAEQFSAMLREWRREGTDSDASR